MDKTDLPDPKACSKLSKTKAICYLSKVIDLLDKNKCSTDPDSLYDLIQRLSDAYFDYYNKCIDEVCDEYINKNVLAILNQLIRRVNDKTLDKIGTFLVNFSSHSEKIASGLKEFQILNFIIDKYLEICLSDLETCKASRLFKLYITIIHNFSCNPNNKIDYKEDKIKNTLLKIIKTDCDDYFGIISMLILSFLINENETELLSNGVNILNKLLAKINFTSKSPLRSDGFTLAELMHGLRNISINDDMKKKIDEENGLPLLIDILKNYNNDNRVIESTLGVIENLCFDDDVRNELVTKYNLQKIVKSFMKSKCEKIRKICEGINWEIEKKNEKNKSKTKKVVFDAFLSYSWANKTKIKEILKNLKKQNIRVWFDEEQMRGSSLEAMADGIENSSLFIIGISSDYRKSTNCRREAEYASKLEKTIIPMIMEFKYKPRSWLGIIVGNRTYFEFSERRDTNEVIGSLIKEININLTGELKVDSDEDVGKEKLPIKNSGELVKSVQKSSSVVEKIRNWSNEEILEWLDKNQLGKYKNKFRNVNGVKILQMKETANKSPEFFNKHMETDFGMDFMDLLNFNEILKFDNL